MRWRRAYDGGPGCLTHESRNWAGEPCYAAVAEGDEVDARAKIVGVKSARGESASGGRERDG